MLALLVEDLESRESVKPLLAEVRQLSPTYFRVHIIMVVANLVCSLIANRHQAFIYALPVKQLVLVAELILIAIVIAAQIITSQRTITDT
jgi:hypothetical protein